MDRDVDRGPLQLADADGPRRRGSRRESDRHQHDASRGHDPDAEGGREGAARQLDVPRGDRDAVQRPLPWLYERYDRPAVVKLVKVNTVFDLISVTNFFGPPPQFFFPPMF